MNFQKGSLWSLMSTVGVRLVGVIRVLWSSEHVFYISLKWKWKSQIFNAQIPIFFVLLEMLLETIHIRLLMEGGWGQKKVKICGHVIWMVLMQKFYKTAQRCYVSFSFLATVQSCNRLFTFKNTILFWMVWAEFCHQIFYRYFQ